MSLQLFSPVSFSFYRKPGTDVNPFPVPSSRSSPAEPATATLAMVQARR
jgi:hypothetical protein